MSYRTQTGKRRGMRAIARGLAIAGIGLAGILGLNGLRGCSSEPKYDFSLHPKESYEASSREMFGVMLEGMKMGGITAGDVDINQLLHFSDAFSQPKNPEDYTNFFEGNSWEAEFQYAPGKTVPSKVRITYRNKGKILKQEILPFEEGVQIYDPNFFKNSKAIKELNQDVYEAIKKINRN